MKSKYALAAILAVCIAAIWMAVIFELSVVWMVAIVATAGLVFFTLLIREAVRLIVAAIAKHARQVMAVDVRATSSLPQGSAGRGCEVTTLGQARHQGIDADSGARLDRAARRLRAAHGRPLRIAAIVDDFTRNGLTPEADLTNLTPNRWKDELEASMPDLLFVESAWRGFEDAWHNTVPRAGAELTGILDWCRGHDVPTVFWAKEDPIHFSTFARVWPLFDYVFTTDLDCIPRYARELGHTRIGLMPFASQPKVHHPLRTRDRKNALVFAGGYYTRYPERARDLHQAIFAAQELIDVEIYDRSLGTDRAEFQFPSAYEPLIVGTLAPDEIDKAYKGYRFALNMNSVKSSQTMCARRVFELLMSGTPTISNYARGLENLFGDLVPRSDGGRGIQQILQGFLHDRDLEARVSAAGLHKVLREHTYGERLRYIQSMITGDDYRLDDPGVWVVAVVRSEGEYLSASAMVETQRDVAPELVVICDGWSPGQRSHPLVRVVEIEDLSPELTWGSLLGETRVVIPIDPAQNYGPMYCASLLDGFAYADAEATTKPVDPERQYAWCDPEAKIEPTRTAFAWDWICTEPVVVGWGPRRPSTVVAVDRLDFAQTKDHALVSAYDPSLDCGNSIVDLVNAAKEVVQSLGDTDDLRLVDPSVYPMAGKHGPHEAISVAKSEVGLTFNSALGLDERHYFWFPSTSLGGLWAPSERPTLFLESAGELDLRLGYRWFDESGGQVGSSVAAANTPVSLSPPPRSASIQVGVRVAGPGVAMIGRLFLQTPPIHCPRLVHPATMLVSDAYPSYDAIYRYGFIHTRVKAYAARGHRVDVVIQRNAPYPMTYREYEGQTILEAGPEWMAHLLEDPQYDRIVVHFLKESLWRGIRDHRGERPVFVWVHGSEIQPWWRRRFEFANDEELAAGKKASQARMAFWKGLFTGLPERVHFVIVSQAFAQEIADDYHIEIPRTQRHIIHNPIDTDCFHYVPKRAEDRMHILLIRPFANTKYANDLAVQAIVELSEEPWFDELQFTIVGDGELFADTVAPLRRMSNVTLRQEFLTHTDIAELHRDHGVFLVPTRCDAQGVSRDEAMASGLVPVTNDLPAIREFLSTSEGIMAPPEDAHGLAEGIRFLYANPSAFLEMSAAAARRVRNQSSVDIVINAELALIEGR